MLCSVERACRTSHRIGILRFAFVSVMLHYVWCRGKTEKNQLTAMAISVQRPVHFLVAVSVSLCVLQPPRLARLLLFLVIFVGIDRSCWPKKNSRLRRRTRCPTPLFLWENYASNGEINVALVRFNCYICGPKMYASAS